MADEEVDVVVIGSGAGGAPLTSVLISSGRQVLVLEKGPLLRTQYQAPDGVSDFKRDETFATGSEKRITIRGMANLGDTFYSSHVEPDLNDEPHVYEGDDGLDRATIEGYTAQVVGGGTQLYGGVSLRFTPDDFRLASFNEGRTDLRDDPTGDVQREAATGRSATTSWNRTTARPRTSSASTALARGSSSRRRRSTTRLRWNLIRSAPTPPRAWTRWECGATARRLRSSPPTMHPVDGRFRPTGTASRPPSSTGTATRSV
ncbi:MAG TPA: hypothetical protein VE645_11355 [Pseudonocardiaceae bacterium]|nr:hypothetical protein [Pseudonocardiaceae bacterium]